MKRSQKIIAILLTAAALLWLPSCKKQEAPQESSHPETTSAVSEESSKEESSKQESSKKESSKKKETSSKAESSKPQESQGPVDYFVDSTREVLSDFTSLLAQNPDTVGWVNIPNSVVDYPVLQSPNDAYLVSQGQDPYYLCRDFYHNDILSGSIFLDYRSSLNSKNLILHGHHMMNGSMFATIIGYNSFSFYQMSPVVTFNSLYEKSKWKIIAVVKTNTLESQGPYFDFMRGDFGSEYDFLNYVYQLRMRSLYNCPVTVNENDTIITMSTCAYDFEDFRMFIVARKVREGEDSTVNVGRASINPNPLYPDIWYYYYGGSKPEVTSFQDALNKKKITWYDGTKKWSQKDDDALPKMLADKKKSAVKHLQTCYDPLAYEQGDLDYIKMYVDAYEGFINEADNVSRINALTYLCEAVIRSVHQKPVSEVQAAKQKQTLEKARKDAIAAIQNVTKGNRYRAAQQEKIDRLLTKYTASINAAKDVSQVRVLKEEAIPLLNAIQTDEEIAAKERSS